MIPVRYSLKKQKMSIGANQGKALYYAQFKLNGQMSFDELCETIADGNTLSKGEAIAVLYRLADVVKAQMEQGRSVDCGELGIFRPSFSSNGVADETDFNVRRDMRTPKITFKPKKKMKRLKVSYQKRK